VSEEEIEPELKIRTSDGRVVTERKLNFRVAVNRPHVFGVHVAL